MTWVVVSDPIPAGASHLGTGLGRDSRIAAQGEQLAGRAWPAFEERAFEAFRAYYRVRPQGQLHRRVHDPAEPERTLPASHDACRGAVRAGDVRRAAQRAVEVHAVIALGRGGLVGRCLARRRRRLWTAVRDARASASPAFESVRAAYRPSDVHAPGSTRRSAARDSGSTRDGRRLAWTPLADVSPALQGAVIASEDRRFYRHGGVDGQRPRSPRPVQHITGGPPRGASTITMQLAALTTPGLRRGGGPTDPRRRNGARCGLAWAIEAALVQGRDPGGLPQPGDLPGRAAGSLGGGARALREGAPRDHGSRGRRPGRALSVARTPARRRSPAVPWRWLEASERKAVEPWRDRGGRDARTWTRTVGHRPPGAPGAPRGAPPAPGRAWHRGRSCAGSFHPRRLDSSRSARTFSDATLLAVRERHVQDGARPRRGQRKPATCWPTWAGAATSPALRYVDGIRARRQAGSTLKPFLYGLALERRLLTPASLLEDTPLDLPVAGGLYRPQELRRAVQGAGHGPDGARRIAERSCGPDARSGRPGDIRRAAPTPGIRGADGVGEYYGPSLALGSADVSLWELVNAYRALANGGVWTPLRMTPEEAQRAPQRRALLSRCRIPGLATSWRTGRAGARPSVWRTPSRRASGRAVKTGTSKEMRDNWCVGYSRRYTVGVWVGKLLGRADAGRERDHGGRAGLARRSWPGCTGMFRAYHRNRRQAYSLGA